MPRHSRALAADESRGDAVDNARANLSVRERQVVASSRHDLQRSVLTRSQKPALAKAEVVVTAVEQKHPAGVPRQPRKRPVPDGEPRSRSRRNRRGNARPLKPGCTKRRSTAPGRPRTRSSPTPSCRLLSSPSRSPTPVPCAAISSSWRSRSTACCPIRRTGASSRPSSPRCRTGPPPPRPPDGSLPTASAVSRVVFDRAHARGELADAADSEMILDLLGGNLWFRTLVRANPPTTPILNDLSTPCSPASRGDQYGRSPTIATRSAIRTCGW